MWGSSIGTCAGTVKKRLGLNVHRGLPFLDSMVFLHFGKDASQAENLGRHLVLRNSDVRDHVQGVRISWAKDPSRLPSSR